MRLISAKSILGVGLGIGLACFSVSQLTSNNVPELFTPGLGEFNALDKHQAGSIVPSAGLKLVQFQSDEQDNQMKLPKLNQVVENDLQLAAELVGSEVNSNDDLLASYGLQGEIQDAAEGIVSEAAEVPELVEMPGTMTEMPKTKAPNQPAASNEGLTFQVQVPTWKANPFIQQEDAPVQVADTQLAPKSVVDNAEPLSPQIFEFAQGEGGQPVQSEIAVPEMAEPAMAPTTPNMAELEQWAQTENAIDRMSSNQPMGLMVPGSSGPSRSVAQKAAHHIEYGKSLARRKAFFAAKQEFYSGLKVLAQASDSQQGTKAHSLALRDGILAMKEAEEFLVEDTESQIGLSVEAVSESHRINLLTPSEKANLSPIQAMQKYFAFAEERLKVAGGKNVVAAEALFCLGRLHSVTSESERNPGRLDVAKAIIYHRAALQSDARNHRSANELGVLMAKSGQFEEAKQLLKQSLQIHQAPEAWQNLAKIHERLGEGRLAQLAVQEHQRVVLSGSGSQVIQWVPIQTFNALTPNMPPNIPTQVADVRRLKTPPQQQLPPQRQAQAPKSIGERIIDGLKRR